MSETQILNIESDNEIKVDPRNPKDETFLAFPENPSARGFYDGESNPKLEAYIENQRDARQEIVAMIDKAKSEGGISPEDFEDYLNEAHYIAVLGKNGDNKIRDDVENAGKLREKYYYSKMPDEVVGEVDRVCDELGTERKVGEDVVRVRRFTSPLNRSEMTGYTTKDNVHNYPVDGALKKYMKSASEVMTEFSHLDGNDKDAVISKAAEMHQILAVSHPYEAGNQSISMNLANAMLETHGIEGIPHDISDAVAISVDKEAYDKYFSYLVKNKT